MSEWTPCGIKPYHALLIQRNHAPWTRAGANEDPRMKDIDNLRNDLTTMMRELRSSMQEIDSDGLPQAAVVNNARDRLHYIGSLTEQAASRTLTAAENILPILKSQRHEAEALLATTDAPEVRAFLERLLGEHAQAGEEISGIIEAQAFQDLVGQVVNKLVGMVQKMEDSLAHLLMEEEPAEPLSGPAVRKEDQVSQTDIDDLFD